MILIVFGYKHIPKIPRKEIFGVWKNAWPTISIYEKMLILVFFLNLFSVSVSMELYEMFDKSFL